MAPPLSSLCTLSFFIATVATLLVASTLRLLAILPTRQPQHKAFRKPPIATRIAIVLGSGGHTHEMFHLLRDLDTRKYTHRTYIVSSGDAFSAARAREFESMLEEKERALRKQRDWEKLDATINGIDIKVTDPSGRTRRATLSRYEDRPHCLGPDHFNVAVVPRARKIHQSLLTTPFSCLWTFLSCFTLLLSAPPLLPGQAPLTQYEDAAADLPDLIVTNGPATAVIVVLAGMFLRFFNVKGAESRAKCRSVYVESVARVKTLSLSGKLLLNVVDRFLVQWVELEGKGGRAEFWGVLV